MASPSTHSPPCLLTTRDLDILSALNHCPLTVHQILKVSRTFSRPFTDEKRVRERMQILVRSGRVRRFAYATAGRGAPNYYTLSPLGYQLLLGPEARPPTKRYFEPVAIARQHHTRSLADFVVHTIVACKLAQIEFTNFYRENTLRLDIGDSCLYPDCAFRFDPTQSQELSFFVELDNSTERIRSDKELDSWQHKIRLYDRLQDDSPKRFRVLVVTTRSKQRLNHILAAAAGLVRNPRRSLFYGVHLDEYVWESSPLTTPCFADHRGQRVALVPAGAQFHLAAKLAGPGFRAETRTAASPSTITAPPCYARNPAGSPA